MNASVSKQQKFGIKTYMEYQLKLSLKGWALEPDMRLDLLVTVGSSSRVSPSALHAGELLASSLGRFNTWEGAP
jgi:hypothetical protein